ncbi:uncharacterized protein LMH87_007686 [Akanthomyces muscarius]|uniref:C2H2-type domain-containing protein n=1 Tax=Akanthomyces muscarius TaxID=2231603 RepID=A0A9W8QMM8_AKAMU|nr:uncharacterized protein LMH87_007686 [Akanthomyces muscarius]KAJ4161660.1 hypothetical protein LMH87_007686 [Akanthomyces muscarius]
MAQTRTDYDMLQPMMPSITPATSYRRRDILPSAPGRPAALATGAANNTFIPTKDADGKFPCPHCTKTYLQTKHLKRHLLRHTGDRPYMCVLCRDTFSRSDILKRHFTKCSIRRGNPTGASHLSHPQAYVKKNAQAHNAQSMPNNSNMSFHNDMPSGGMQHLFGMFQVPMDMDCMSGATDVNSTDRQNMHDNESFSDMLKNNNSVQFSFDWA